MTYSDDVGSLQDLQELNWVPHYFSFRFSKTLFPGTPDAPLTSNNRVTIDFTPIPDESNVPEVVFGGLGNHESVIGNSVKLINGKVAGDILGGFSLYEESSRNTVEIEGSEVGGDVYGGYSNYGESSGNTVEIKSGTVNNAFGGNSLDEESSGNIVRIEGGRVNYNVRGGRADLDSNKNIVEIKGGTVGIHVIGGESENGSATGNIVTLNGDDLTTFGAYYSTLYGGYRSYGVGSDIFTGNTLNKNNASIVPHVVNFEFVNFGYTGEAKIDDLDTSPGASQSAGVTLDTGANDIVFKGVIKGDGALTKKGAGTLALTGENTFTENLVIEGGLIQFEKDTNLGASNKIVLKGGGLQWGGDENNILDISGRLDALGAGGGIFDTNNRTVEFETTLTGEGGITKQGAGVLILTAENEYKGGTTILGDISGRGGDSLINF
ncbi:MAG: autotransporter-associated beta strand repeat-containing protein, partial [Candidatus Accumulibacter sp.]|nr:autotransporter-associated beta strand repeat-containing protein [Accumulibacter sp.]